MTLVDPRSSQPVGYVRFRLNVRVRVVFIITLLFFSTSGGVFNTHFTFDVHHVVLIPKPVGSLLDHHCVFGNVIKV